MLDETTAVATTPADPSPGRLRSLVYVSRSTTVFTDADLTALLTVSRRNNERLGLTGMLLYRRGRFLQLLEGPETAVLGKMGVIAADSRHDDLRILLEETIDERLFPSWTMGFHSITDEMSTQLPGYRAAFDDLDDSPAAANSATLPGLRALIRWFQDRDLHH